MKLPLLSLLPLRLRVFLLVLVALILFGVAASLYVIDQFFTSPPPAFQAARTMPNTDVNPYGANFFLEREVEAWKRERTVEMARDAGIGYARQEFIWAEIEPQPGTFSWNKYDAIVDLFRSNNMQVIARIDNPPTWARPTASATGSSGPPDNFDDYGKFIKAFVQHYQGKIYYLQIWNEPNLSREWNDLPIAPAAYTKLLKIAYTNAKAVNPNVRILSAPLAITLGESFAQDSTQYRNMNDLQFLEEMYNAGAKDYFDILSANAFGLGSPPDDPPNPGKLNFQRVLLERAVMEKYGDAGKAVWILEYGWNAAPDWIPDSRLIWGRVTEQQQAEYTAAGIQLARQNWDWVGVVSTWFFRQVGNIPPENPEAYFRMVDVDFTPRPVYFGVSAATKQLEVANPGEFEETDPAMTFSGNWQYQFDSNASGGQFIHTSDSSATATLNFYGQSLDVLFERQPSAGRLYVTIDGKAISSLPSTETGQSFIDEAAGQAEWHAATSIAKNLSLGQHTAQFHADGQVNIDGFVVAPIPPMQPPWLAIGLLSIGGIACFALAWNQSHSSVNESQPSSLHE